MFLLGLLLLGLSEALFVSTWGFVSANWGLFATITGQLGLSEDLLDVVVLNIVRHKKVKKALVKKA